MPESVTGGLGVVENALILSIPYEKLRYFLSMSVCKVGISACLLMNLWVVEMMREFQHP